LIFNHAIWKFIRASPSQFYSKQPLSSRERRDGGSLQKTCTRSNAMIVEYIRYTVIDDARGAALQQAYLTAAEQLDAAPECLAYELSQCEEDPKSWILRIEWTSTEAHLNGFRKGAHFPAFLQATRGFMPEITEMRHYRRTTIQSRKFEVRVDKDL
jgi:quinol monooxygenase YgiN